MDDFNHSRLLKRFMNKKRNRGTPKSNDRGDKKKGTTRGRVIISRYFLEEEGECN